MEATLKTFIISITTDMRRQRQYSAAKTCISVLRGLCRIAGKETLTFSNLKPELLATYEHHLITDGRSRNTVSLYMRTLHNICNRANHEGVASVPADLFNKVFTGTDPVRHKAISSEVIRQINEAVLEEKNARLKFARDMFMLSFYLRGIPYIDLAFLRECDLKDGFITYCRKKTQKMVSMKVEACALKIIKHYTPLAKGTSYLLPIIKKQGTAGEERKQYESALRLHNKHLNKISEVLGLDIRLTSYVARHSWATIAHDAGVQIADISEALSHSSEKMTKNYIRSFTPDRLAAVNRKVINCVTKSKEIERNKKNEKREITPKRNRRSGSL